MPCLKINKKYKLFIAIYFDNYKQALECAIRKEDSKGRTFEVITNNRGYFVVSKAVLKNVFNIEKIS